LLGTTRIKIYIGLMTTSMDRKDKTNWLWLSQHNSSITKKK
jgi:hypothetical protein